MRRVGIVCMTRYKNDIIYCVDDNTFLAHSLGTISYLKDKNYNFKILLGNAVTNSYRNILEEMNFSFWEDTSDLGHSNLVFGQWGPACMKDKNQLNYLMHNQIFDSSRKFYLPHGLEIKKRKLKLGWRGRVKEILNMNYSEYQNSSYFFDTSMHAQRMKKYEKKLGTKILKNTTFFSKYTPSIMRAVLTVKHETHKELCFLPKIEHVGRTKFHSLLLSLYEKNYDFIIHPREVKEQKLILRELNINYTCDLGVLDIFGCKSVYDFGTSVSAITKLIDKPLILENHSNHELIFDSHHWMDFLKEKEEFVDLEYEIQKYL